MESVSVDFLVFCTDCFYLVALLLKLHDKVKNCIRYRCLYQATSMPNIDMLVEY